MNDCIKFQSRINVCPEHSLSTLGHQKPSSSAQGNKGTGINILQAIDGYHMGPWCENFGCAQRCVRSGPKPNIKGSIKDP